MPPPHATASAALADALRQQALLLRRLRRHDEAAAAWTRLLALPHCPPGFAREAAQALAIHHEHRLRDPRTARALAMRSLAQTARTPSWQRAVAHRLARLDRKLGREVE
jgi:hypothetical protein